MLPVYNAISFQDILLKGGKTKPWIVLVDVQGKPTPYVVKLFETITLNHYESVANEVIGSLLAKEFGLPVPSPALIKFDDNFQFTINNQDAIKAIEQKDERIKFGCKLIDNVNLLPISAFKGYQLRKFIDIDTVFAFDVLIRNRDRNATRPNLILTNQSDGYVIDHEVGFEINNTTAADLLSTKTIPNSVYNNHIFLNSLKKSKKNVRKNYFDTFDEYLKYLNVNSLVPYLKQLNNFGYRTDKHAIVIDYLNQVKVNRATFVNILKGII